LAAGKDLIMGRGWGMTQAAAVLAVKEGTMSEYKVGDRVELCGDCAENWKGKIGTVTEITGDTEIPVRVKLGDTGHLLSCLAEHIRPAPRGEIDIQPRAFEVGQVVRLTDRGTLITLTHVDGGGVRGVDADGDEWAAMWDVVSEVDNSMGWTFYNEDALPTARAKFSGGDYYPGGWQSPTLEPKPEPTVTHTFSATLPDGRTVTCPEPGEGWTCVGDVDYTEILTACDGTRHSWMFKAGTITHTEGKATLWEMERIHKVSAATNWHVRRWERIPRESYHVPFPELHEASREREPVGNWPRGRHPAGPLKYEGE